MAISVGCTCSKAAKVGGSVAASSSEDKTGAGPGCLRRVVLS